MLGRVMPAVVTIQSTSGRGSGFFVAADTLLTNVHVIGSDSSVTIRRADGSTMTARVDARSQPFDIAILRITPAAAGQVTIPMGQAGSVRVGQEVIAIGSALGRLQNTVTRGIVSGIRRSGSATLVQTDTALNPGNSGGPLLDRRGTAIGINTMGYSEGQGLNFAVAIDHARALLEGKPAVPAAAPAFDDLRDLSPAVASDADRQRTDGQKAYEAALADLARRADAYDREWSRFTQSCYGGAVGRAFDREWFAVLAPGTLTGAVAPQCADYFAEFKQQAEAFRDEMVRAAEAARRSGVYPGVQRDALRKYRLGFDAWTR